MKARCLLCAYPKTGPELQESGDELLEALMPPGFILECSGRAFHGEWEGDMFFPVTQENGVSPVTPPRLTKLACRLPRHPAGAGTRVILEAAGQGAGEFLSLLKHDTWGPPVPGNPAPKGLITATHG